MSTLRETAYPRLNPSISQRDLDAVYTPTSAECELAKRATKRPGPFLAFLILLKTFQRLGYFVHLKDVPPIIVAHIAKAIGLDSLPTTLASYDQAGSRKRHIEIIRAYRGVKPFDKAALRLIHEAITKAAATKRDMADLINVALDELIRHSYELPAFTTLKKEAAKIRAEVYRSYFRGMLERIAPEARAQLDQLFVREEERDFTAWNELKADPGTPTLTHLKEWADRLEWLQSLQLDPSLVAHLPDPLCKEFAEEARSLDAARMASMKAGKRYTLALALFRPMTNIRAANGKVNITAEREGHFTLCARARLRRPAPAASSAVVG